MEPGALHRPGGCRGQRQRHAEDRHEPVAQVFIQGPLVLEDQVHHLGEEDVEHLHHLFRVQGLGHGGKITDIGKEHGDFLAPAPQLQQGRIFQDLLAHLRANVARDGVPEQVFLLIEAQAAAQDRLVMGLLRSDLPEESLEFRIFGLLGQGLVALPGLQLMGDGQLDGLDDVKILFAVFGFPFSVVHG